MSRHTANVARSEATSASPAPICHWFSASFGFNRCEHMDRKGRPVVSLHLAILLLAAANQVLADEWSWIDSLHVADGPTKQWLKTCISSDTAHLAAVRFATFDFEGITEESRPLMPGSSKVDVRRRAFSGRAKWSHGKVHYEVTFNPGQNDESKLSVLRTDALLARTERHELYRTFLIVDFPPTTEEAWARETDLLSAVDPKNLYAIGGIGVGGSTLRSHSELVGRIESEETGGQIHITFYMKDSKIALIFTSTRESTTSQ